MDTFVLGINHKTAPVEIREKFAFTPSGLEDTLNFLLKDGLLQECVILSTCNRTEIYATAKDADRGRETVFNLLGEREGFTRESLEKISYFYACQDAVAHLFQVAAGLDSMILGETQILGQVKQAYETAAGCGSVGKVFHALFSRTLGCGKKVHTETKINENATSVSYASVELAKKIFGRLTRRSVLVIGAGEMSELTLRHLLDHGAAEVTVTNRTKERAEKVACNFGGKTVDYEDMEKHLETVDIVISSTGAPHFIITKPQMARIMRARKNRPLFIIDIAVPRDIDPAINSLGNVYLYDIDDLQEVVASNLKDREKEARRAELIIAEEVKEFQSWFKALNVVPLITALRKKAETIRQEELQRELSDKLAKLGKKEQKAVDNLTKLIVNRLLREPVLRIKEFAVEDKSDAYVASLSRLFDLEAELPQEDSDLNSGKQNINKIGGERLK